LIKKQWYIDQIRRRYTDVRIPLAPGFSVKEFLDLNLGRVPIFYPYFPKTDAQADRSWESCCELWPFGFSNEVRAKDDAGNIDAYIAATDALSEKFHSRLYSNLQKGSWEENIWKDSWENDHRRALFLAKRALAQKPLNVPVLKRAAAILDRLIHEDPYVQTEHYKNLGLMYQNLVGHDPNAVAKVREIWGEYLKRADPGDPQATAIRAYLYRLKDGS
jgi:hypothetical protein